MRHVGSTALAIAIIAWAWPSAGMCNAPGASGAAGKAAFQTCAMCHSDKPGVSRLGPSLTGIFGQSSAQAGGFRYSAALSAAKLKWDRKTIDAFIARPRAVVPGTSMAYPGISDPAKRGLIIDYLESLK